MTTVDAIIIFLICAWVLSAMQRDEVQDDDPWMAGELEEHDEIS